MTNPIERARKRNRKTKKTKRPIRKREGVDQLIMNKDGTLSVVRIIFPEYKY